MGWLMAMGTGLGRHCHVGLPVDETPLPTRCGGEGRITRVRTSRRHRVLVAVLLFVSLSLPGRAQQNPGGGSPPATPIDPPRLVKIKDDVYLIQNVNDTLAEIGPNGGNVTVYLTDDGVILIDSKNDRMHDDIVAKVKSLTDRPIKYVILTHNHNDHAGGSAKMQAMGATVVMSAADREHMLRMKQAGPAQVAYAGHTHVFLGGKEARLREFRGHTRGDTVVHLPAARVVIAGDLVTTPDAIPQIVNYGDGGNWTDLGRTLDEIAQMDFDILVGGHGPPLTKQAFLTHRDKVAGIREGFRALNREGKSQDEIARTLIKEFNWGTGPAAGNMPGMAQELR